MTPKVLLALPAFARALPALAQNQAAGAAVTADHVIDAIKQGDRTKAVAGIPKTR